jgi:UDP-N-acetylmuramoyl-tripeptide--D-alanyl-D-alanine ligase
VDDTYNANPDSVRAAIDVLAELPGPRLLVLGDMGEVGDQGPQFHAEVGDCARAAGIEQLWTLGEQSRAMRGRHFEDVESLNAALANELPQVSSMLVKGSRFMKMERVVTAAIAMGQNPTGGIQCCLASPSGCRRSRRTSASCACSSTSPSARSWPP